MIGIWNHRVIKIIHNKGTSYEDTLFCIREVFYNSDGNIWLISDNDSPVFGNSIFDINETLDRMKLALEKDVIDLDEVVFCTDVDDLGIDLVDSKDDNFEETYAKQLKDLEDN